MSYGAAMFYLAILVCSAAVVCDSAPPARRVSVPLRYATVEQFNLPSLSQHTFIAELGCENTKNATISVCAELPNNWDWQDFKGYVYMNVFNTNITTNLSAAVASTGKPESGQLASQCVNATNWPGGDMYIRVDANSFSYVVYTISVKIYPATSVSQKPQHRDESTPQESQQAKPEVDPNGTATRLQRVISADTTIDLEYNMGVMLELDLCLPPQKGSNIRLATTVLADTGLFTHYICKDENCTPDSPSVIGNQVAPLPSGSADAGVSNRSKVYVSVYNLAGEGDKTTGTVMGHFRFGADLYTPTP